MDYLCPTKTGRRDSPPYRAACGASGGAGSSAVRKTRRIYQAMKDQKNDSTQVLARFGRDKRVRVVKATAERVERRPRLQRDAADSEQPYQKETARRASYNPHFTEDNRPKFDNSHSPRPAYGRYGDDERPRRDGEHGHRTAERSFRRDERPQHGDERPRTFDRDSRNSVRAGHSATVPPVREPHRAAGHRAPSASMPGAASIRATASRSAAATAVTAASATARRDSTPPSRPSARRTPGRLPTRNTILRSRRARCA